MKPQYILAILLVIPTLFYFSCDEGSTGPSTQPPNQPSNPYPANGATNVGAENVTLSWTCGDPVGGELTYMLTWYISHISQSLDTVTGLTNTEYTLYDLHPGTQYRWQVAATDEYGETNYGPPWEFTTEDEIVTFNDYILELLIRGAISMPTGDLYASYINDIYYFPANNLGIEDITGLEYLIGTRQLSLSDNSISVLSPLSELVWLERLTLTENQISNISPLSGLNHLEHLEIAGNQISDLSPLSGMVYLEYLQLGYNQISDLSPLAGLNHLEYLYLNHNNISDLTPLSDLVLLQDLVLDSNQVADLSPLSDFILANHVSLMSNQISDISPLSGLLLMYQLDLADNQISNISALSGLALLHNVYLSDNEITSIEPLVNNIGLGSGDYVHLYNNPLDSMSVNVYIPELEARGVSVYY